MKRYGDNVTSEDISEAGTQNEPGPAGLLFGGCGATYGSFPAPAKASKTMAVPKKPLLADLLPALGVGRKKAQEE